MVTPSPRTGRSIPILRLLALLWVLSALPSPNARAQGIGQGVTEVDWAHPLQRKQLNDQVDPPKPMDTDGDPVIQSMGGLFVQETDLTIPGRGMDFALTRTYRSNSAISSSLGPRWDFNYNELIVLSFSPVYSAGPVMDPFSSVLGEGESGTGTGQGDPQVQWRLEGAHYYNGQLRIDTFQYATNGVWQPPAGYFALLKHEGTLAPIWNPQGGVTAWTVPSSFRLRGHDGTIRTFAECEGNLQQYNGLAYRLTKIEDRFGNQIRLNYGLVTLQAPSVQAKRLTQIVDTLGRTITFGYAANGWLSTVTDSFGRVVAYEHDWAGRLTNATSPLGRTQHYEYDPDTTDVERYTHLRKAFDAEEWSHGASAHPYLQNTYDANGRVVSQTFGGTNGTGVPAGGDWCFVYEKPPLGVTLSWSISSTPHSMVFIEAARTLAIDPNGNTKLTIFDAAMGERLVYRFTGRLTGANSIDAVVDLPFSYSSGGTSGSINAASDAIQLKTTTAVYLPPLRPSDPHYFLQAQEFNAHGQLTWQKNAGGDTICEYDYGAGDVYQKGNLLRKTSYPSGGMGSGELVWLYAYEPLYNQLRASIDPRGTAAGYVPANGGTASLTRYRSEVIFDYQEGPADTGAIYTYASDWRINMRQAGQSAFLGPLGWSQSSILDNDNLGDQNGAADPGGFKGLPIVTVSPSAQVPVDILAPNLTFTSQAVRTKRGFNVSGLLKWEKDELGNETRCEYNSEADPDGDGTPTTPPSGITLLGTTGEDGGGFLKKRKLPLSIVETLGYDAIGRATSITNGRGQTSTRTYNLVGELTGATRADGAHTAYVYDLNGSLVEERRTLVAPSFDANGMPTGHTQPREIVDHFSYDLLNQLVTEDRQASPTERLVTKYRYDRAGSRVLTLLPECVAGNDAKNVVATVYDERGLVLSSTRGGVPTGFGGMHAHDQIAEAGTIGNDAKTATVTMSYTAAGGLAKTVDALGHEMTVEYDGFQRPKKSSDAVGDWAETEYNVAGELTGTRAYQQGGTLLSHAVTKLDELGRAFETSRALFTIGQGPTPQEGALTPGDGFVTRRQLFDAASRVTTTVDDDKVAHAFVYDALDRLTEQWDALGNGSVNTYDKASNRIHTHEVERDATGAIVGEYDSWAFYDEADRMVAAADNTGRTTRCKYDSLDRPVFTSDPQGSLGASLSSLDLFSEHTGLPGMTINGDGNTTLCDFDDASRQIQAVQHLRIGGQGSVPLDLTQGVDGKITTATVFDKNGRVVEQHDDAGNVTRTLYDALDRAWKTVYGDGTEEWRVFDKADRTTEIHDANGSVVAQTFDEADRLTLKTVTRGSNVEGTLAESYSYDGLNRIVSASDDDSTVSRGYDSLSRIVREVQNGHVVDASFKGEGRLLSVAYPGGRVIQRGYDSLSRVTSIQDQTASLALATYVYAGAARLDHKDSPMSGVSQQWSYDAIRRVSETKVVSGTTTVDWRTYTHDRASNKKTRTDQATGRMQNFEYDSAYRMLRSERAIPGQTTQVAQYDLDGVHNRTSVTANGSVQAYSISGADLGVNQYTATPGASRTYDENGNLRAVTGAKAREAWYDYRNQMVRFANQVNGHSARYAYDCFGRRIKKTVQLPGPIQEVTQYIYQGERVIEERNILDQVIATHVPGIGRGEWVSSRRNGSDVFYGMDELGSVVKLFTSVGGVIESYEYGDFGALLDGGTLAPIASSAAGNRWFFTGQERDFETGYSKHARRYLEPEVGRFTTRDPIGIWGDPVNSGNGAAYAGNNPWSWVDPLGLKKEPGTSPLPPAPPAPEPPPRGLPKRPDDTTWLMFMPSHVQVLFGCVRAGLDAMQNPGRYIPCGFRVSDHPFLRYGPFDVFVVPFPGPCGVPIPGCVVMPGGAADERPDPNHPRTDSGNLSDERSHWRWGPVLEDWRDVAGSCTPYIGEAMDLYVMLAPGFTGVQRGLAAISFGLNCWFGGVLPNYGATLRIAERAAGRAAAAARKGGGAVADALNGLRAGRSPGVKVVGSVDELNGLFGRLTSGGKTVEGGTYPGRMVTLPDGTTVGLRTGSKSGGPTIDIKLPDGTLQKVHVQQ